MVRSAMSASLAAVMVTPGSTAPVVSVTVPSIAPVVAPTVWPAAPCPHNSRYVTDETRTPPGLNTSFPQDEAMDGHFKLSARACCASSGATGGPIAGAHTTIAGGHEWPIAMKRRVQPDRTTVGVDECPLLRAQTFHQAAPLFFVPA